MGKEIKVGGGGEEVKSYFLKATFYWDIEVFDLIAAYALAISNVNQDSRNKIAVFGNLIGDGWIVPMSLNMGKQLLTALSLNV